MSESGTIDGWREALLSSKGILRDYVGSYFVVGGKYDRYIVLITFVGTAFALAMWNASNGAQYTVNASFSYIKAASVILRNISTGILGFLVAAFAIFMSTTSKILLIQLSKLKHKKLDMSEFRFILISYMSIFIDYIFLLIVSAISEFLTTFDGAPAAKNSQTAPICPEVMVFVNIAALALLLALSVQAILQLKSFLINLYGGLVLYVATLPEEP